MSSARLLRLASALAVALSAPCAWAIRGAVLAEYTTTAVAAFPDVEPPSARMPPVDPNLELLKDPYEASLSAAVAARNLYGDGLDEDPYLAQLSAATSPQSDDLQDPYEEELALMNPYSSAVTGGGSSFSGAELKNPYSGMPDTVPAEPALKAPYPTEPDLPENPHGAAGALKNPYDGSAR